MAAARQSAEMLADQLTDLLTAGLPQDQASLDTVLATLGEPLAGLGPALALARLAADPDTSEHAPLVALLLSPGQDAMRALEPVLAQADLDATGALVLADELATRFVRDAGRVLALLPDGSRAELAATSDGLRAFVRRLRPEATAPAELRQILARRCGPDLADPLAVEVAVILRHCRLAWTPERVFFLATLLERVGLDTDDLPGLVAWAASFLDLSGLPLASRRALGARRQELLAQLRQAEALEEALARGSYEILMSQGLRAGHVHGPSVRVELAFLERAALLVLGLSGAELDGLAVRDLGQAQDAEGLLRFLPGLED